MRVRPILLFPVFLLACAGGDPATDGGDGTDSEDTDASRADDTDEDTPPVEDDTDVDPPADANAKAVGTWSLGAPGSTCNISFAGDWTGVASEADAFGFTLTSVDEATQILTCRFDAVTPTTFTCANYSQPGMIPPNCDVAMSLTVIGGEVVDSAASLIATVQVTSSMCGLALNCGPTPHLATGTIAP